VCAGQSEAFGRAGDQYFFAVQFQIQDVPLCNPAS
jgi:hypothetical protein